jgi:hypothetical protein
VPAGQSPATLDVGDVDGDGVLDVVTGNSASHDVSLLLGDGTGGFAMPVSINVGNLDCTRVVLADLDNDHRLDLAVASYDNSPGLTVLQNYPGRRCTVLP